MRCMLGYYCQRTAARTNSNNSKYGVCLPIFCHSTLFGIHRCTRYAAHLLRSGIHGQQEVCVIEQSRRDSISIHFYIFCHSSSNAKHKQLQLPFKK